MKTIEEMLQNLARADVTEFAVVTDCLPCVNVAGKFKPVDKHATKTAEILEMLVACGGSRYVDSLGPKPTQWAMNVAGVGTVAVRAVIRDEVVQARFSVTKRDPRGAAPPAKPRPAARQDDDDGPTIQVKAPPAPPPAAATVKRPPAAPLDDDLLAELDSADLLDALPASTGTPGGSAGALFDFDEPAPPKGGPAHELDLELDLDVKPARGAQLLEKEPKAGTKMPSLSDLQVDLGPMMAEELKPSSEAGWPPPYAASRQQAPAGTIEYLLALARSLRASDLHVVPERPLLLRIAGELVPRGQPLDAAAAQRIVDAIVPERLRPQLEAEGSCDFALADTHGRCRVNVGRQRTGYKISLRLIPSQVPTLEALGLPPQIGNATHHHQGLILVTGPTGHGKTTTLAAIVNIINTETTAHVITVEDPIEFIHPRKRAMMSQREVGTSTKSFQAALKGSLREDPDVVVVGELRDTETVRMALSASETGHLVIGTMNTPSAAKTIDRLIDLFPPADQAQVRMTLAGGLRLIVSQRLIPNADKTRFVACAELLPGSISLWSLIRDNKTFQIPSLQQRGKGIGIIRIDDSLVDLVKAGKTTLEIAKEWAENPEELEISVQGKRAPAAAPSKPGGDAAKDTMAGLMNKAGSLFRKGGG